MANGSQVPSTVNRAYSLAYPNSHNFALNYVSSFVLPLQGFWNSIIYMSISWPAFKTVYRDFRRGSLVRDPGYRNREEYEGHVEQTCSSNDSVRRLTR